jgi:hypothetical protein
MRQTGPESAKSYQRRKAGGFFDRYLSGANILDIGYKGGDPANLPVVEHAVGVDRDFPGYDGLHLPFPDLSQDTVFSSHCYEHIGDYRAALCDWYRVLRVGGYMVIIIPHKYLYERKSTIPSLFNPDHKRFYTPAALLREVEDSLPVNGFRVRHLADNDAGFDYRVPSGQHAVGCYEIELVIQKIMRPPQSDSFELSPARQSQIEEINRLVIESVRNIAAGLLSIEEARNIITRLVYFPTFETIRSAVASRQEIGNEQELRAILKQLLGAVNFDDAFYRARYPDIEAALRNGVIQSAIAHFIAHGYFEGRAFQQDPAYFARVAHGIEIAAPLRSSQ